MRGLELTGGGIRSNFGIEAPEVHDAGGAVRADRGVDEPAHIVAVTGPYEEPAGIQLLITVAGLDQHAAGAVSGQSRRDRGADTTGVGEDQPAVAAGGGVSATGTGCHWIA